MRTRFSVVAALSAAVVVPLALLAPASADEGMWLVNKPPSELLLSTYSFAPTAAWLEHQQKSAVSFGGGSGSLVSADGLVMTNHHVGSDSIAKLSGPGRDLLETGFLARTRAEELQCPDLELSILWTIQDVTDRVKAAGEGMATAEANTARRKMMSTIEKEANDASGLEAEIVTLYQGGQYHLYSYKRYTDVRLVFAPEQQIAFFGGDTDNFEFPRFCLDVCFFRIYENGQPLKAEHFLKWSPAGAGEGDLALVFGHPGRTNRQYTTDHMRFMRDVAVPTTLRSLNTREIELQTLAGRSAEHARIVKDDLFGVANGRKATVGEIEGLLDPAIFAAKGESESRLKTTAMGTPLLQGKDPWTMIAQAQRSHAEFFARSRAIGSLTRGPLAGPALSLVRLGDELPKPSAERLREYRDTNLPSVYLNLYSEAPIYDLMEVDRLASALTAAAGVLGADDPVVKTALGGLSPRQRAQQLVSGTTLKDIAARKALAEGGASAIAASTDPLIVMARGLDAESRALRTRFENEVEAPQREAYALIAAARFAAEGDRVYPDATGTLRMSFGPIRGWEEGGNQVPAFTDFSGLYARSDDRRGLPPFDLPPRWVEKKDRMPMGMPFNFVCSADIIGGNSGSPVVNTAGEVIGLIFDGNLASLVGDYVFDERSNRAVAVDSRAIEMSLREVYDAAFLADELTGR